MKKKRLNIAELVVKLVSGSEGMTQVKCPFCGATLIHSLDAFLRSLHRPLKKYYFSYGYTRDPKEMTEEVRGKVLAILEVRKDIYPAVPHFMFDALYNFPVGYSHPEMAYWEVEEISRCDAFVYDPYMAETSAGVKWELAIAKKFNKPIFTYDEVLEGRDID